MSRNTAMNSVLRKRASWVLAGALVLVGLLVYANSFQGQFVFDDEEIKSDMQMRPLWPPADAFAGPRPLTDFSFAVNYRISGFDLFGFHLVNLACHIGAALFLFLLIRRTVRSARLVDRFGGAANSLAFACATLWMVHPIQTEAVTYIVQRAESLSGFFCLAAMYFAARGFQSERRGLWHAPAAILAFMAMAAKPQAVTLPLLILFFDRTFYAGTFWRAIKKSALLYSGLAVGCILFGWILAPRQFGESAGFSVATMTPWMYLRSQPGVILKYLQLSFWPATLCIDYGWKAATGWAAIVLPGLAVVALLITTIIGVIKNRPWSFLGVWFFGALAVTSSFVPIADICVERRMYLPLAAVVVASLLGVRWGMEKVLKSKRTAETALAAIVAIAIPALGARTFVRNELYKSPVAIWEDVIKQNDKNGRGWTNLGSARFAQGENDPANVEGALAATRTALALDPADALTWLNMGRFLQKQGNGDEALKCYMKAKELNPKMAAAWFNIGNVLRVSGKYDEAIENYKEALAIERRNPEAWNNLGIAYMQLLRVSGQKDLVNKAMEAFINSLLYRPKSVEVLNNLGMALGQWQQLYNGPTDCYGRAEELFQRALALDPNNAGTRRNLNWIRELKAERQPINLP